MGLLHEIFCSCAWASNDSSRISQPKPPEKYGVATTVQASPQAIESPTRCWSLQDQGLYGSSHNELNSPLGACMPSPRTVSKKSTIQTSRRRFPMSLRRMNYQLRAHTKMKLCKRVSRMRRWHGWRKHRTGRVSGHGVRIQGRRQCQDQDSSRLLWIFRYGPYQLIHSLYFFHRVSFLDIAAANCA